MQPTLLLDLDGPVADFDGAFFLRCAERGFELEVDRAGQRHRFASDHIADKAARRAARAMVDEPGWFRDLPVTEGAYEGIDRLTQIADVWLCTKPLDSNPTCCDEKRAWVAEWFGGEWEQRLIITSDKSMVRGHGLLDDAPYIEWISRALWRPIIFAASYNGEGTKWAEYPRWNWQDDIDVLSDLLVA